MEIADGNLTVTESGGGHLAIYGNISDDNKAESLIFNGDGSGVLALSGTNTYGGETIVQAGTLIATSPAGFPPVATLLWRRPRRSCASRTRVASSRGARHRAGAVDTCPPLCRARTLVANGRRRMRSRRRR